MGKYINIPQAILGGVTATNTAVLYASVLGTDGAAEGKVTDSVADFVGDGVVAGDFVIITTAVTGYAVRSWAEVTAVDDLNTLSVTGPGLPATGTGGLSASGTIFSVIAAADAYQCVVAGSNFTTVLRPGDWVLNTNTKINYQVNEVLSDTAILLTSPGSVIVGDTVDLVSNRGEGSVRVCIDNATLMRGNISNGELTIHYKKGPSAGAVTQKLAISPSEAITDDAFAIEFMRLAEKALSSQWTNVTEQMTIVGDDGAQGLVYAGALTWS